MSSDRRSWYVGSVSRVFFSHAVLLTGDWRDEADRCDIVGPFYNQPTEASRSEDSGMPCSVLALWLQGLVDVNDA